MRFVARQGSSTSTQSPGSHGSSDTSSSSIAVRTPQITPTILPTDTGLPSTATTSPTATTPIVPTGTTTTTGTTVTDTGSAATTTTSFTNTPTSTETSPSVPPTRSSTTANSFTTSTTLGTSSSSIASSSSFDTTTLPPTISSQSSSPATSPTSPFTTMTTAIDGQLTTLTSNLPTSLSTSTITSAAAAANRTAIIAGGTTAAVVSILILLGAVFLHHRHKLRKRQDLSSIQSRTHQGPREGRGLLAGEDDDDDTHTVLMRAYRDSELATHNAGMSSHHSLTPSFHRPRASETGSIFREEEVWPPPAEFVDPFLTSVRRNQEVDLGRIVDDVMGPGPGERTGHTPSSTFSSGSEADRSAGAGEHGTHRKSGSGGSYIGLLDEFGARRQSQQSRASSRSTYSDPYDPPVESGIGNYTAGHGPLLPGAAHVAMRDLGHDPIVIAPGTYSLGGAASGPSVAEGLAASKPKKSSPLVRAISSASHKMGDTTRLWLDRKVRKVPEGGSAGAGMGTDVGMAY